MAELTNTEYKAKADANIVDNITGLVSPADVRDLKKDVADSFVSRQVEAWGEWQHHTNQIITTGSRLLAGDDRLEDRGKSFLEPLWDKAVGLIDLQFIDCKVEIDINFTATALANNTSLAIAIRDSVTSTVFRATSTILPKTASETYELQLKFTVIDDAVGTALITNKAEIFLVSDGTVTISDVSVTIDTKRKFTSL